MARHAESLPNNDPMRMALQSVADWHSDLADLKLEDNDTGFWSRHVFDSDHVMMKGAGKTHAHHVGVALDMIAKGKRKSDVGKGVKGNRSDPY